MVKLEMSKPMEGAIKRAVKIHNSVKLAGQGRYVVISGHSKEAYQVTLRKGADGFTWAWCDCPAGKKSVICHHIISAGWTHKIIQRMRRAVAA